MCLMTLSLSLFPARMYGLFQTSFYFGYMAVFSTALGIMCGKFRMGSESRAIALSVPVPYWIFAFCVIRSRLLGHQSEL